MNIYQPQSAPVSEKIPIAVLTDDGRDVDDIEALAYLAGSPNADINTVITTHMIPDRRAFIARSVLNHLGSTETAIGVGSIFPLGKEDELLIPYLRQHTIQGRTYEGDGLIECFPDGEQLLANAIETHGSQLKIAVLAPLTDLAKAARRNPDAFSKIGGIFIQGQALINDSGTLEPDPAAYNLKEDMQAATEVFKFQGSVPFTLVGKHSAYQVPLDRDDFARFYATGNPVGSYLQTHAIKGIACFAERAPEVFERVFGVPADQLSSLQELSKPYDALVAKAIVDPKGLAAQHVGHHTLIGMTSASHGVEDAGSLKEDLINTILRGLTRAR